MSDISILMIDDERAVLKAVSSILKRENMLITCALDSTEALHILENNQFDLILLDIMMPGQDGLSLLRTLRSQQVLTPVILLSGREEDAIQVEGLGLGADDYITKPFSKTLLVSKIRAIIRRNSQYSAPADAVSTTVQKGNFTLHMASQTVFLDGREISLTSKEFALLCLFVDHPERTFSKQELFSEVWRGDSCDDSTILVYIKKLRSKIEKDPANPLHIRTVWGKGYQFLP